MKKIFLLLGMMLISLPSFAQDNNFFNPINTISKVPQSPEVAAFEKFSGSVNMYTGTPSIGIPLYTIQGKELSLPVSLSYDASGIKVDQKATNVGLGWSLNYGGVISRNVNGHPDQHGGTSSNPDYTIEHSNVRSWLGTLMNTELIHGDHPSQTSANYAHQVYSNYYKNQVDLQPDTFSFSVNGLSGTIVVDYDNPLTGGDYNAYCLEHPNYIVSVDFLANNGVGEFIVIDDSGHKYTFGYGEETNQTLSPEENGSPQDEYQKDYYTAWYLTKIESVNGLDTFDISYGKSAWTEDIPLRERRQMEIEYIDQTCPANSGYISSSINELGYSEYVKDHVYPVGISYNGVEVMGTTTGTRVDLPGAKRISQLEFFNRVYTGTDPDPILVIGFDNDQYFGSGSLASDKRLKLDGISIYRDNSSDAKVYAFTYDRPNDVPNTESFAIDFWGYYTGRTVTHAVPDFDGMNYDDIAGWNPDIGSISHSGSQGVNRKPDFDETEVGTLTSIIYPTGGKSSYDYEQHLDENGDIVGGLRIRKVTSQTNDPVTGEDLSYSTYYYYGDKSSFAPAGVVPSSGNSIPTGYNSSGITQQWLIFNKLEIIDAESDPSISCFDTKRYFTAYNRAVEVPNDITYTHVIEVRYSGATDNVFEGLTETEFYNGINDNSSQVASDETSPYFNENLHFGDIKYQKIYDSNLNLLGKTYNQVTTEELSTSQFDTLDKVGLIMYPNPDATYGNTIGGNQGCYRKIQSGSVWEYRNVLADGGNCPTGTGWIGLNNPSSYSHYHEAPAYGYKLYWKKLVKSESWSYEGSEQLDATTTYTYGSSTNTTDYHFFATKIEAKDSKNRITRTEIFYPTEKASLPDQPLVDDTELTRMKNRNQLSTPLYVKKSYQADSTSTTYNVISEQRRIMTDEFTPSSYPSGEYMIMPKIIQVAKGSDDLEDRMEFHQYDEDGNLLEYSYPDGMRYINIWGYKGDYLLAEIKNSTYYGITTPAQNAIDDIIDDSDTEDSESEESSLFSALNALRSNSYFSGAQIQTYVYDPGIGVKRTADVRGYKTRYYYDQHNRFDYATDEDGNVLSKNEYSLRINN